MKKSRRVPLLGVHLLRVEASRRAKLLVGRLAHSSPVR